MAEDSARSTQEQLVTTFEISAGVVNAVAADCEAAGVEPTAAAVRDRLYDHVTVEPRFRARGRPVADAVREQLDAGE